MALIKCPECGQEISDRADSCPKCAYPIAGTRSDGKVRIKISIPPDGGLYIVRIFEVATERLLAEGRAGGIFEFSVTRPTRIKFCGVIKKEQLITTVDATGGGRYNATWKMGFFSPVIGGCSKVDVIDSD
ncbi:MAG: zinc ribbon domain-containing protein [Oscillospiraceae bacterium]|jgi:hypothetical protein|nr:zinc ribbon domain-containing protein [Oscillospiraceae bacterium]